jgi:alpha-amylase
MNPVVLAIVIHNHQPRGNWDRIFRKACDQCYDPFVGLLESNSWFVCGLHYSGCLLEWMDEHRPDIPERLRALVERGQVEPIGGGYYDPIFTMLPERDRRGQVESFSRYLVERLGRPVSGLWLPERVWEQSLVPTLADCGITYTVLDDAHFKSAGLRPPDIRGYYLTEDQGRLLRVFASDENLRYWIPFAEPEQSIRYLAGFAREGRRPVVCYGDDGEKFGLWPETFDHCYKNKWLERFFAALKANADWLHLKKPGDVIAELPAEGKVYLPDSSYREMMEWALPAEALAEYEDVWNKLRQTDLAERVRPFLRGGTWRNFKTKYVAAARMYARMMEASELAERAGAASKRRRDTHAPLLTARRSLYQGQCNCAYWHGVFGGLYLPQLRRGVYADLIRSIRASEQALGGLPAVEQGDFDLDGAPELKLNAPLLAAYLKPGQGGRCYELDLKDAALNLLATMHRQKEAYHRKVVEFAGKQTRGVETIHALMRFKQPGLEKHLVYDPSPRDSLIDHILPLHGGPDEAQKCQLPELGDFVEGAYEVMPRRGKAVAAVVMRRDGAVRGEHGGRLRIRKKVSLREEPPALVAEYELSSLDEPGISGVRFATEFNVAISDEEGGNQRFYFAPANGRAGPGGAEVKFDETAAVESQKSVGLGDDWLGLDVRLEASQAATIWLFPIQTVNQSEAGFELNYQCNCIYFVWPLDLPAGSTWRCTVTLTAKGRSS